MTLLMFSGLFLIGLILLQRGRGGGLAGAFGGMGGQSAFGTKAGDVFTRITIGVAITWILLCGSNVIALHRAGEKVDPSGFKKEGDGKASADLDLKKAPPKTDGAESEPVKDNVPATQVTNPDEKKSEDTKTEDKKPEEPASKVETPELPKQEPAKADETPKPAEAAITAPPVVEKPADGAEKKEAESTPAPQ